MRWRSREIPMPDRDTISKVGKKILLVGITVWAILQVGGLLFGARVERKLVFWDKNVWVPEKGKG